MRRRATFRLPADGVLDDVVYDVGRRVVDATGFPDFGLLFYLCLMSCCQAYDFAEELFVNLATRIRHRLTASG